MFPVYFEIIWNDKCRKKKEKMRAKKRNDEMEEDLQTESYIWNNC